MQVRGSERALTMLGYLPLVAALLLVLKVRRDSMFVQFHVRQSWVLFLLLVAVDLVLVVLLFLLPGLSAVLLALVYVSWGLYLFFMAAGIVKSSLGERYRMPVVADVALMMRL